MMLLVLAGTWIAAFNEGMWFETFDQKQGGVAGELLVARAASEHVFVGGRLAAMTEFDLGDKKKDLAHVVDVGPTVGVVASSSRFRATAATSALLTSAKYHDDGWVTAVTPGLGLDGSASVHGEVFGFGLHVSENLNTRQSATCIALRIEISLK